MKTKRPFFNGIRLGLLLQIGGIGPISVLLFQLPMFLSFSVVLLGVLGVTAADAVYIGLAALGVAPLAQKVTVAEKTLKAVSGMTLIILGAFFISMIGNESRFISAVTFLNKNIFWGLFILTLMNPATIFVFTGLFTAELLGRHLRTKDLSEFALGVLITTPLFLGTVAAAGAFSGHFLPPTLIKVLNAAVGAALMTWGGRRLLQSSGTK